MYNTRNGVTTCVDNKLLRCARHTLFTCKLLRRSRIVYLIKATEHNNIMIKSNMHYVKYTIIIMCIIKYTHTRRQATKFFEFFSL